MKCLVSGISLGGVGITKLIKRIAKGEHGSWLIFARSGLEVKDRDAYLLSSLFCFMDHIIVLSCYHLVLIGLLF